MVGKNLSKAKGGIARAKKLSPDQRSEIAKKAAKERWSAPKSVCFGDLEIGEMTFPCSVLSDGTRVLTQSDFMKGMGMYYSGWVAANKVKKEETADIPHFLAFKSIEPFAIKHLGSLQSIIIKYRTEGGNIAHGIKAEIIPKICDVWMDADENIKLGPRQKQIAKNAKILIRSLARVGIIALVDEATGYQDIRARNALAKILESYILEQIRPWTRTFPETFYKEIFRLRGWTYFELTEGEKPFRPGVIGKYTNDLVYERLAPGIREELERKNPRMPSGKRKGHHHRWFTPEYGHPKLAAHIEAITALMRVSTDWAQFQNLVDRAYPKPGGNLPLPLDFY